MKINIITIIITLSLKLPGFANTELSKFCKTHNFKLEIDIISEKIILSYPGIKAEILPKANLGIINSSQIIFLTKKLKISNSKVILPENLTKKLIKLKKNQKKISRKIKKEDSKIIKKNKINYIILDPGHGGKDPGNINNKIKEKNITLKISKKLKNLLKKRFPKINIILTRKSDKFISLKKRSEIALSQAKTNTKGIFISIHANASLKKDTLGIESYFYSSLPNKDKHQRLSCFKSLSKVVSKNKEAQTIISHLYNLNISKKSRNLAKKVNKALYSEIKTNTKNRGVKTHQPYFVITKNILPSILIEIGFLSNKKEAENIKNPKYQNKIVKGIVKGIVNYIK